MAKRAETAVCWRTLMRPRECLAGPVCELVPPAALLPLFSCILCASARSLCDSCLRMTVRPYIYDAVQLLDEIGACGLCRLQRGVCRASCERVCLCSGIWLCMCVRSCVRGLHAFTRRVYAHRVCVAVRVAELPRKVDGLEFVHFPIVDCAVVSDSRVLRLCKDLVKRLIKGENMYIHCW